VTVDSTLGHRTTDVLRKAEEAASKKVISETAKQCPGCKRNIEKAEGCDHMTCKAITRTPKGGAD
jgi:hypothetical protein